MARHDQSLFWTPDKTSQLRVVLEALWAPTNLSYDVLGARLEEVGQRRPAKKTLQNFRANKELARSPELLTALCTVLSDLASKLPEQSIPADIIDTLSKIAAELKVFAPQRRPAIAHGAHPLKWQREHLEALLRLIPVPGPDIDPTRPEFPATNPRYPATPIHEVTVKGREIMIKDESWNWTGSHKDRWAWEHLLVYRQKLLDELHTAELHHSRYIDVPQMSVISNGSAAFALQALLRLWSMPPLKVLVAKGRINPRYVKALKSIGAEVYEREEVDTKELFGPDICELTENPRNDMDITRKDISDSVAIKYYDWLVCEVLLKRPRYIFCPVGTGDLFFSIVKFIERELSGDRPRDLRIKRLKDEDLTGITILGATTERKTSNMDKLYARWRPSLDFVKASVSDLVARGKLGPQSRIYNVEDNYAIDACEVAQSLGINTEFSGIAGLALFLEMMEKNEIPYNKSIMVINTGWFSPVLGTQS
ncbi:MAG: pyridoxal-phosphate dependent enzyme [Pseudomonadota bacterium]